MEEKRIKRGGREEKREGGGKPLIRLRSWLRIEMRANLTIIYE